jgi:uncharacterized membrane protein YfcA
MHYYVIAAFIGLVAGVTSGLFGVGGGIVMVPAMFYLLKVDIKTAIGTSLVVIIPTAIAGALKHNNLSHIDWRVAGSLTPLAVAGGFLGAYLAGQLDADVLKKLFGGLLVLAGIYTVCFK